MKFIWGLIAGVVLVPIVGILYLASGFAPTAATEKPLPLETWLAETALRARMQKEAPLARDLSAMPAGDLMAGADIYKKNCAVCHGLPDQPAPAIANAMFPPAPQLLAPPPMRKPGGPPPGFGGPKQPGGPGRGGPRREGDFWRVKNGIRLTGMPSFENTLSDEQIWQVLAVLEKRRDMPPDLKAELAGQPIPAPTASSAAPAAPVKSGHPPTSKP